MIAMRSTRWRPNPRQLLVVGALALAGGASLGATSANAVPASQTIRCTSGKVGFDFCKNVKFRVKTCRRVGVKILDSGDDRWIKIQVRKPGEGSSRWESEKLRPDQSDSGQVAGRDRFKPAIWVDAEGISATAVTLRIRFSGC